MFVIALIALVGCGRDDDDVSLPAPVSTLPPTTPPTQPETPEPETPAPSPEDVVPLVNAGNATDIERAFFYAVNATRVAHGLNALIWHDDVATAARAHSQELVDYDRWTHEGVDGSGVADRIRREGVQINAAGENLGAGERLDVFSYMDMAWFIIYGRADVPNDPNSWMGSPGHRANMLNPDWTHTGLGVAVGNDNSRFDLYITQKFIHYP